MVDIDEKSLNALGQWPWPRIILAKIIHKINSSHPSAVALDIMFTEKDRTSPKEIDSFYKNNFNLNSSMSTIPQSLQDNDLIFSSSLKSVGAVMGIYLSHNVFKKQCNSINSLDINLEFFKLDSFEYLLCNTPSLKSSVEYNGFVNTYLDEDAVLRRMPLLRKYNDKIIPSLSLATLLSIDSDIKSIKNSGLEILNHKIRTDEKSNILLNFYNDNWYKKISIIDLLNNKVPREMITGKIVLLGSSAVSLHDQIIISGEKKIAGVKVHVTMLDNILHDDYLVQPNSYKVSGLLISLAISFLLLLLLYKRHTKSVLLLFTISLTLISILTIFGLQNGVYISVTYFLLPFLLHFFLISIFHIIIDTYDKYLLKEKLTQKHIAELDGKIKERTAELVQSHKHIKDNINYAALIQSAILPDDEVFLKYTDDYFVFWRPKNTVGGDIYFATELNSKEEVLIMVIDGAGHGVSGAFVTILVKAIEAQIVADIKSGLMEPSPALILEYFNKSIKTMLKQNGKSASNAGFDGGILYYNSATNVCKYAGAKTPLYILNNQEIEILKSDRKNVGYIRTKMDQKYTEYDVKITKETKLYISTDGYFDQEGLNNRRYTKKSFEELILNISKYPFKQQKHDIISELEKFQYTYEQSDDITVIGLRFR